MAPPGMRIDLFIKGAVQEDGEAKNNNGRDAICKRDSDEKSAERTRGGGDRGMSVQYQISLVALKLQQDSYFQQNKEAHMIGLKLRLDGLDRQITRAEKLADFASVAKLEVEERKLMADMALLSGPSPKTVCAETVFPQTSTAGAMGVS